MVGRAMVAHCTARGDEVFAHERANLDITKIADVRETFTRERPDTVINCAAWTDVDGCELNPERAILINAEAVEILAAQSRLVGASFVTISTDYVFDGEKEGFYTQRDDPEPHERLRHRQTSGRAARTLHERAHHRRSHGLDFRRGRKKTFWRPSSNGRGAANV
jgi:dTDP-4-dehydrorhamnose reductase